jgi:hypothetical protein
MSSAASISALRQLFESHASQVSTAVESLVEQAREGSRREFADQLNQAVRRIRQAADLESIGATLLDTVAAFCDGAAWFRVQDDILRAGGVRGGASSEEFREFEIAPASAAAFGTAVASRDPVIAAATPSEVSAPVAALAGCSGESRVSIHPLVVRDEVPALLCAWGNVQESAVELLTQVAAGVWAELSRPPTPPLLQITPAPPQPPPPSAPATPEPPPRSAWESLSAEEQQIHLRAQRFARVQVAEIRLRDAEAVQAGRAQRDLYSNLRKPIDSMRESFRKSFFAVCPSMVDYVHLELLRTLAHDDPELLGKDYPGPMA